MAASSSLRPRPLAAMIFIHPELLDLGHTCPTVADDRTYLNTVFIDGNERQPFAVIPTGRTSVMTIKSILQEADISDREMVLRQDMHWRCSHARPSIGLSGRAGSIHYTPT
jgi:hypothetical protein